MKISEVKKELLNSLILLGEKNGYKVNKGKFALIKKDKEKTTALQFTTNHWDDEVQLMPAVCVDIVEINNIWKQFDEYIGYTFFMSLRKLKDWSDTGTFDKEKFRKHNGDKYMVLNQKDLKKVSEEVEQLFIKYGLPYINNYASIEGADTLLNSDLSNTDNPHSSGFHKRCVAGLIAAKLANNPNYMSIAESYTLKVKQFKDNDEMDEEDIERFFKVKEYLSTY